MTSVRIEIPRRYREMTAPAYADLLRRLAATPAVKDAFAHFGTERVSDTYHIRMGLRLIDPLLSAEDRTRIAKDLLSLAPKMKPKVVVPRGCKVSPIPDLAGWHGAHRFWQRLRTNEETGCWEFRSKPGTYGRIRINGKLYSPHRVAYTLKHGPIPVGKGYHGTTVMHSCDNPPCCNPAHLSLGTQKDNVHDMVAKGRCALPIPSASREVTAP